MAFFSLEFLVVCHLAFELEQLRAGWSTLVWETEAVWSVGESAWDDS